MRSKALNALNSKRESPSSQLYTPEALGLKLSVGKSAVYPVPTLIAWTPNRFELNIRVLVSLTPILGPHASHMVVTGSCFLWPM